MMRGIAIALAMTFAAQASGQSFSCRIGTRPACLDYGDTICSTMGKCVDANAVCFDRFQCGFEGFTCRSNVTACVDKYDDLVRQHNDLANDYNGLLRRHNTLVNDYNDLLEEAERIRSRAGDAQDCVQWARSLEEAKFCF